MRHAMRTNIGALLLALTATAAQADCLRFGVEGTVVEGRLTPDGATDPTGREFPVILLDLSTPACVVGDSGAAALRNVRRFAIISLDLAIVKALPGWRGHEVRLRGTPHRADAPLGGAPVIFDVTAIEAR